MNNHKIQLTKTGKPRRVYGPGTAWRIATETEIAYAAGLFDGEGNVVIARNDTGGERGIYQVYNMRVGVSQNDSIPLFLDEGTLGWFGAQIQCARTYVAAIFSWRAGIPAPD